MKQYASDRQRWRWLWVAMLAAAAWSTFGPALLVKMGIVAQEPPRLHPIRLAAFALVGVAWWWIWRGSLERRCRREPRLCTCCGYLRADRASRCTECGLTPEEIGPPGQTVPDHEGVERGFTGIATLEELRAAEPRRVREILRGGRHRALRVQAWVGGVAGGAALLSVVGMMFLRHRDASDALLIWSQVTGMIIIPPALIFLMVRLLTGQNQLNARRDVLLAFRRCGACGYDLHGAIGREGMVRCPECGAMWNELTCATLVKESTASR
jgi:hypothetical protein